MIINLIYSLESLSKQHSPPRNRKKTQLHLSHRDVRMVRTQCRSAELLYGVLRSHREQRPPDAG